MKLMMPTDLLFRNVLVKDAVLAFKRAKGAII
jgi:hypothetical protein